MKTILGTTRIAVLASALGLWNCDPIVISRTPGPKPAGPILTMTGLDISPDTLVAGGSYPVAGLLEAGGVLTRVEYSLWTGGLMTPSQSDARVLYKGLAPGRSKWDLRTEGGVEISTDPTAPEGRYTFKVKALVGDSERTYSADFSIVRRFDPKTAETIVGIWRTNLQVPTEPPTTIRVTLQIDPGGSMVISQRVATGRPSPEDFVDISREFFTWTIDGGFLKSVKTACEYRDPATLQPTSESDCREPLESQVEILVSHKGWTMIENGVTTVFRKD